MLCITRCSATAEIVHIGSQYAVQGHSRSLLDINQKSVCDFILVNNNSLHPSLHRFLVIVQYLSNHHLWRRGASR